MRVRGFVVKGSTNAVTSAIVGRLTLVLHILGNVY